MDFVGISLAGDKDCGLLKFIGCDKLEKGKPVPQYFRNIYNKDKIYTLIHNQDEFINYRSRREDLDYFNPFVKHKNTLMLLLMCTPVIYEKVIESSDSDEDDIVDLIVDDELSVTQEEILNHVRIKQFPVTKNDDGENFYKYGIYFTSTEDDWIKIESITPNKIASMIMLMIKTMSYFDEPLRVVDECNGDLDQVETILLDLLEKYNKERELNRKDIKKIKFDNTVEVFQSDEFDLFDENSVEDALNGISSEPEEVEGTTDPKTATIDVTNIYKDAIPIYEKGDDDDIVNLEYF
jgi:hypothetical protein